MIGANAQASSRVSALAGSRRRSQAVVVDDVPQRAASSRAAAAIIQDEGRGPRERRARRCPAPALGWLYTYPVVAK